MRRRIAQFPRREELLELFGGGSLDSAPGQILWQGLGDAAAQVFVVYKLIHEALSNAPQFFRRSVEQFMRAQPERFAAVFTRETLWSLLAVSPKLEVPRELLNRDRIISLLHELNSRGIWRRNDGEIRREADYILSVLESNRHITEGFDALRRLQLEKANAIVRGNVLLFVPARLAQYTTEVCALGEKGMLPSEEELLAKVAEFGRDRSEEGRHISIPLDVLFTEFGDNNLHCFIFARTSASLSERRDLRAKSLFIRHFLGEAFRAYPPKNTSVRIAFYLDDDKSFRSQSAKERLFHKQEICDLSDFWSSVTGSPTGFRLIERIRDRAAMILKRDGVVDQIRKHFARERVALDT